MPKQRKEVRKLADLQTYQVDFEIDLPDGTVLVLPIATLTWNEWLQAERDLPFPKPPQKFMPGSGDRMVPDTTDPTYQAAVSVVNERRRYWRVIKAFEKRGVVEIPGATLDDKLRAVQEQVDGGILIAIIKFLYSRVEEAEGRVEKRAESFHESGPG